MENKNLVIRKATKEDINLLYELINGLAIYEKRPNDMTGSIEMLSYWLFEKSIATALIAENDKGELALVTPDKDMPAGAEIC